MTIVQTTQNGIEIAVTSILVYDETAKDYVTKFECSVTRGVNGVIVYRGMNKERALKMYQDNVNNIKNYFND